MAKTVEDDSVLQYLARETLRLKQSLTDIEVLRIQRINLLRSPALSSIKDVHTEHCCSLHGCKYGDEDCTVTTGKALQSYCCEYCSEDW